MKLTKLISLALLAAAAPLGAQSLSEEGSPQEAKATYHIVFQQGKYDILPAFNGNADQVRRMKVNLSEALTTPGFTLDSIVVVATASPEGSWQSNAALSTQRGQAMVDYIRSNADGIGGSGLDGVRFCVKSVPENWEALDALVASDRTLRTGDKVDYARLASYADPDEREAAMRKSGYYSYVSENLYPRLRVVELSFRGHGTAAPRLDRTVDTVYVEKEVVREVIREVPVKEYIEVPVEKEYSPYRWAVSTNAAKWAFFGTANIGVHLPLAAKWSAEAQVRYNPWTFYKDNVDKRITWRERTFAAGARLWQNGCFEKGFYAGLGAQHMQFNRGGVFGKTIYEGSAVGGYLKAGYLVPISRHWKFEAGLGVFGGYADYNTYDCNVCGKKTVAGKGWIFSPDEVNLSIVYVF